MFSEWKRKAILCITCSCGTCRQRIFFNFCFLNEYTFENVVGETPNFYYNRFKKNRTASVDKHLDTSIKLSHLILESVKVLFVITILYIQIVINKNMNIKQCYTKNNFITIYKIYNLFSRKRPELSGST